MNSVFPFMGRILPKRKVPLDGRGWKEGGVAAECHPRLPRTWKKHFVSLDFKGRAITSNTQEDRTSLHVIAELKNAERKEPRLQKLNGGTHPRASSLITSPGHGYKQH